jgi:hypothetical protein
LIIQKFIWYLIQQLRNKLACADGRKKWVQIYVFTLYNIIYIIKHNSLIQKKSCITQRSCINEVMLSWNSSKEVKAISTANWESVLYIVLGECIIYIYIVYTTRVFFTATYLYAF